MITENPHYERLACEDHRPLYAEIIPGALGFQKAAGRKTAFAYLVEGRIWGRAVYAKDHPGRCNDAGCIDFYHKLRRMLLEGMADADRRKPAYKGGYPCGCAYNPANVGWGQKQCQYADRCSINKYSAWLQASAISDPKQAAVAEKRWEQTVTECVAEIRVA